MSLRERRTLEQRRLRSIACVRVSAERDKRKEELEEEGSTTTKSREVETGGVCARASLVCVLA